MQLHVRIGVPGRYPGFYFVFCHAKLFVILLLLKKLPVTTKWLETSGFAFSSK